MEPWQSGIEAVFDINMEPAWRKQRMHGRIREPPASNDRAQRSANQFIIRTCIPQRNPQFLKTFRVHVKYQYRQSFWPNNWRYSRPQINSSTSMIPSSNSSPLKSRSQAPSRAPTRPRAMAPKSDRLPSTNGKKPSATTLPPPP